MARRRRSYTREFKIEAVKMVTDKGYYVTEAARSLDIGKNPSQLLEASPRAAGRAGLPRPRQPPGRGGGAAPAPRREQTPTHGARHINKATAFFAKEAL
jgi:transposase